MNGPQAGDRISEYVLVEMVGAGSFGQVWKARHHVWKDEIVAIKVPTDSQFVRNLQKEGCTIHGLRHKNIVRAIGLDPYAETPYLVMEFVDGLSLEGWIKRYPEGMPVRTAHRILRGILEGLEHAHANGVVHRDIKPANILIAGGKDKPVEELGVDDVKVTDFGLGRAGEVTANSIMQSGSLLAEDGKSISGTIAYMAPEQRDGEVTDARSDLYAVGIVLFELITGQRPSGSDMPSHLREGLPPWIDPVFARLYTRRERRFPGAADVLRTIGQSEARPVSAAPIPPIPMGHAPGPRPMSGGTCPSCKAPTEAGDNFCISCGRQLALSLRKCSQCGGYPETDDRFCIHCGGELMAAGG